MLETGIDAPDFELLNEDGEMVRLSDYKGRRVVLYFYPRDNTPGCTAEACSLRDQADALDAVVIGVSPDSSKSHASFKAKYSLPFHLLSDPEHKAMELYGAYGEKMMYGKKTVGVIRSTFIIGKDGKIEHIFKKVNTKTHGEDVKKILNS